MRNQELFEEAKSYLVGGVNSPVRAMKPYPFFTMEANGCKLVDVEGREYIDYCLAYGPLILGHAYPYVVEKVREQLQRGSAYGTPTELELEFAKKIVRHVPCAEMVRFVNTGTEATMSAIRLARGYTGRKKILKFEGAFHGAHDSVLVKAGSGATTQGVPTSKGVPPEAAQNTLLAPFNDPDAVEGLLRHNEAACVIVEPVMGNAGCILPKEGYLKFLREVTSETGTLLVFDEVITGFRLGLGGAQEYYNVTPDVTTLGKILGGGLPIGAIVGKREIMEHFSPVGKVYQAGTFNGNPLSLTAGYATIHVLEDQRVYRRVNSLAGTIRRALGEIAEDLGLDVFVSGVSSMFQMYFTGEEVVDYATALGADKDTFLAFQQRLLDRGVFLPPSQYECNFVSYAHTDEAVEATLTAVEEVLRELK
jgi:glutamate-1-semialdehyde 2,1-aminomutase